MSISVFSENLFNMSLVTYPAVVGTNERNIIPWGSQLKRDVQVANRFNSEHAKSQHQNETFFHNVFFPRVYSTPTFLPSFFLKPFLLHPLFFPLAFFLPSIFFTPAKQLAQILVLWEKVIYFWRSIAYGRMAGWWFWFLNPDGSLPVFQTSLISRHQISKFALFVFHDYFHNPEKSNINFQ